MIIDRLKLFGFRFLILGLIIATLSSCGNGSEESEKPILNYQYPDIKRIPVGSSSFDVDSVDILVKNQVIPWELLWGKDNHIWATAQVPARVLRLNPDTRELIELEIIDEGIGKDFFVLGMAFHPEEPYIYLSFIQFMPDLPGTTKMQCKRYTLDTLKNQIKDPFLIVSDIYTEGSANAGGCLFITEDKHLFVKASFESQANSAARELDTLLGKWLRYNLDGSIPEDNPYPDSPIFTVGHRNAQGMVQTPDGKLFTSEHGPTTDDEVNLIEKGKDYGWPDVHGYCDSLNEQEFCNSSTITEPLIQWTPTIAPSSIEYYDHEKYPQLKNCLLVTTLKNSDIHVLQLDEKREKILSDAIIFKNQMGRLRNICISPEGRIFISTANNIPIKGDDELKLPPIDPEIPFDIIAEIFISDK